MSRQANDPQVPDLVSATEAAEMLGVTRQNVQLMANNGQLPGKKVGKTWVFLRSVVENARLTRRGAAVETRDLLIAAGIPEGRIQMPHGVYPNIIINGWTVQRWATNPDRWQVIPCLASSHTGFSPNLTIADVVSIVEKPSPIMAGLRLNDGTTTRSHG